MSTEIIKYDLADSAGVVGQQPYQAKAKFEKLGKWSLEDKLNKIKKFRTEVSNDEHAQANMLIERNIFLPFLTPFYGIICARTTSPNSIGVEVCERAFHLTRKIFTRDDEKKLNWTDKHWYDPLWKHRRKLIVSKLKVADDVRNIPILINVPTNTSFANHALANGDDFVVTSKDGLTKLAHEIENYNSSTGELELWVRVPKVSDSTSIVLYIYYNNPAASNQEDIENVWKTVLAPEHSEAARNIDYSMVQHLTSSSTDSTYHNNDGTDTNITYTDGVIASSASFNGTDSVINVGSGATLDNVFDNTGWLSGWFYANSDGEGDIGHVVSKGDGTTNGWHVEVNSESAGFMKLHFSQHFTATHGEWETGLIIPVGQWTKFDIVYNNSDIANDPFCFVNGALVTFTETQAPAGSHQSDAAFDMTIGNNTSGSQTFDGEIDEIRILHDIPTDMDFLPMIETFYNCDQPDFIHLHEVEEYKAPANDIAQLILDSANLDGPTWTLDQDFPTDVITMVCHYKDHFKALHIIGQMLGKDVWFDNRYYKVFMGQKGKTLTDELNLTITANPEISVGEFASELTVIGAKDDTTEQQISQAVSTLTNLRYEYERVVANNKLDDATQILAVGQELLDEFKKLTPTISATVPFAEFAKSNLQSGDIIPIYQPEKEVNGQFRVMEIAASPQSVKLSLESTETGVIRLRSLSLTGVIEGILTKLQDQSIET